MCNEPIVSRNCSQMTDCMSCVQIGCHFCDSICSANGSCSVDSVWECSHDNNCSGRHFKHCRDNTKCDWSCSKGECIQSKNSKLNKVVFISNSYFISD